MVSAWSGELLLELCARFLKRRNTLAMVVQMRFEWAVGLTWNPGLCIDWDCSDSSD